VLVLIALGIAACNSLPSGPSRRTLAGLYMLNIAAAAGGTDQIVQQSMQMLQ